MARTKYEPAHRKVTTRRRSDARPAPPATYLVVIAHAYLAAAVANALRQRLAARGDNARVAVPTHRGLGFFAANASSLQAADPNTPRPLLIAQMEPGLLDWVMQLRVRAYVAVSWPPSTPLLPWEEGGAVFLCARSVAELADGVMAYTPWPAAPLLASPAPARASCDGRMPMPSVIA